MTTATDRATVGVLGGTGPQGRGLGVRLALAGHHVTLGSRDPDRALAAADELAADHDVPDGMLTGASNGHAADADVVIVAVPFDGVVSTVEPLRATLAGRIVVSCVNRLTFDGNGPRPESVDAGSAAELIARLAPGARVVGAFHHVAAGRLRRTAQQLDLDVVIVGDDHDACAATAALADALPGARGIVAGPLRLARPVEELTAVILAINQRQSVAAGIRLTGLDG